jgi:hypothetical protein
MPKLLRLSLLQNADGGLPGGAGGFARAGEPFSANVKVEMDDTNYPPNFGNEASPHKHTAGFAQPADTGVLSASFSGKDSDGAFMGTLRYDGLGSLDLGATITSANATYPDGTYFGQKVPAETKTVGSFYPAYFQTTASGGMACLTHMGCPTAAPVAGAVYSSHFFNVDVKAFSVTRTDVTAIPAATSPYATGAFPVTLSAVSQPGPAGTELASVAMTGASVTLGGSAPTPMPSPVVLALANPYQTGKSWPATWTAPTSAYVRATADFTRKIAISGGQGTKVDTISSNRGTGVPSVEGGMQVVHGRLQVDNANGSELIKLPLYLHSQYWTGSGWENNPGDSFSVVSDTAGSAAFTNCTLNLQSGSAAPGNCKPAVALQTGPSVSMQNGAATLWLQAPGAGNNGSATVSVPGAPGWLPSTAARDVFGTYKSRVIYMREVY